MSWDSLAAELLLAVQINELRQDFTKVLGLVEKYAGLFKLPGDALELRARTLGKLGRYEEAGELYEELLLALAKDNWRYIISSIECSCKGDLTTLTEESAERVFQLLDKMDSASSIPLRSVHLGRVEVAFQLFQLSKTTENAQRLIGFVGTHLAHFSSKLVCFRDIRGYLAQMDQESIKEVIDSYEKSLESEKGLFHGTGELTEKIVYRRVLAEQLKTKFGYFLQDTVEESRQRVEEYLRIYQLALAIPSAIQLVETERQYADDLVLLAAHQYFDLFQQTSRLQWMLFWLNPNLLLNRESGIRYPCVGRHSHGV